MGKILYYAGTMKAKGSVVPVTATYEKFEYSSEPYIKIAYKRSGMEYLASYKGYFGGKIIHKPKYIIVYNDSADKKRNYYFQGKVVSWLKYLFQSN